MKSTLSEMKQISNPCGYFSYRVVREQDGAVRVQQVVNEMDESEFQTQVIVGDVYFPHDAPIDDVLKMIRGMAPKKKPRSKTKKKRTKRAKQ